MVPQVSHLELRVNTPSRGVMHKDLKLENIMLASVQPPEAGLVKLKPRSLGQQIYRWLWDCGSDGRTIVHCR